MFNQIKFDQNNKKSILKYIAIVVLCELMFIRNAQAKPNFRFEHVFQHFPGDQRPLGTLPYIAQDRNGMMWFAGEKVYRFDGVEVHSYLEKDDDQCSSYIRGMVVDHDGALWIATENGLCVFNQNQDKFLPFKIESGESPIDHGPTATVNVSPRNEVYVGMASMLAIISADRSRISYHESPLEKNFSDGNNEFRKIFFESAEVVWIGSLHSGLVRFTPSNGVFEHIMNTDKNPHVLPSNDVRTVAQDSEGNLWFGMSQGGISKIDPTRTKMRHYYGSDETYGAESDYVWHLLVDSSGQLWVNSDGGGLMGYNKENDSFFQYKYDSHDPDSIASNKSIYTLEDNDKNLWVSLYPEGVDLINRQNSPIQGYRHNPGKKDSLNASGILSILIDSQDRIWIGTEEGLNLFNPTSNSFENYSQPTGTPWHVKPVPITTIKETRDGNFWIGTWGNGLYFVDSKAQHVTHFTENENDPHTVDAPHFWDVIPGETETLFASEGEKGILVFDHKSQTFSRRTFASEGEGISSYYSYALLLDSQGYYWFAVIGGLYSLDPQGKLTLYSSKKVNDPSSISSFRVNSLFEDKMGRIWIGSDDQGAFVYDRVAKTFRHIGREHGLPSTTVTRILESPDHHIWLFTRNGLAKVNPEDYSLDIFHNAHGLVSSNFNRGAGAIDESGNIYAGGAEGLSIFSAADIGSTKTDFPVHITELKLFNRNVRVGGDDSPLKKSILQTNQITLNHKQHIFSFSFTGLSYPLSRLNEYAYKLEHFEKGWNYVGNRTTATYTNIPPGSYTFKVKAKNSDGNWSRSIDQIDLSIVPPPWRTWWAYCAYFISAILLIRLLIRYKIGKVEYEKQKHLNTEIMRLNEEKDELRRNFIADISHELKTPLSILSGELEAIEDGIRPLSIKSLSSLGTEVKIINKLVSDLFDLSLSDVGELKYNFQRIELRSSLNQVIDHIEEKFQSKSISLQRDLGSHPLIIDGDPVRLHQLFLNLLENSYRYTDPMGQVSIRAVVQEKSVLVKISDSAPGVSEENMANLFQRFYRVEPSRNRASGGTGLGLSICRNIAEAHHASIEARPSILGGVCMVITFPRGNK